MSTSIQRLNTKTRAARRRGFTLVEVMVAAALFLIASISAMGALMQALKVALRARYLDRAENILKIAADQFQSAKAKDPGGLTWRPFFQATGGVPTGEGMAWNSQLQTLTQVGAGDNLGASYSAGTAAGLVIRLNTIGAADTEAPEATLTREVDWMLVDTTAGTTSFDGTTPSPVTSAGQLVRATFRIQFSFMGNTQRLKAVAIRNLNPTDK